MKDRTDTEAERLIARYQETIERLTAERDELVAQVDARGRLAQATLVETAVECERLSDALVGSRRGQLLAVAARARRVAAQGTTT